MNYFNIISVELLFTIVGCFSPELNEDAKAIIKTNLKLPYLFDNIHYPPPEVIPMLNRKVFRGRRVSIREHPYVASIRRNVAHYLVGTILTMNMVLTVAHPLIDVSIAELSVVAGENYADRGSMLHTVILMIVHEKFNQSTLEHDIALLRIYEDITFKGSAKSISLLDASEWPHGLKAFVTGWGRCDRTGRELCLPRSTRYTTGEKFDPMLRTVYFYMEENNTHCQIYKNKGLYIAPGMMCQGKARVENEVAACLAVPGAPLVVGARLVGILSWGFSCGHSADLPLIYTNCQFYGSELLLDAIMKVASVQHFKKAYYKTTIYQIGSETSKMHEHFRNMLLIHNNTKLNMTLYSTATGSRRDDRLLQEWMNYTILLQHLRADIETTVRMLEKLEIYNEKDNKGIHTRMQKLRRSGRKRSDMDKIDSFKYMPTIKPTPKMHVKWKPGPV